MGEFVVPINRNLKGGVDIDTVKFVEEWFGIKLHLWQKAWLKVAPYNWFRRFPGTYYKGIRVSLEQAIAYKNGNQDAARSQVIECNACLYGKRHKCITVDEITDDGPEPN